MRKLLYCSLLLMVAAGFVIAGDYDAPRVSKGQPVSFNHLNGTTAGWVQLTQLELATYDYYQADYLSGNVVWMLGWKAASPRGTAVWRSTDNGANFTKLLLPVGSGVRAAFAPMDKDTAVFATTDGKVYRTKNGGTSWDSVWAYTGGFFDGAKYLGGGVFMAYGDADAAGLVVIKSTDAGKTWTRFTNLPATEQTPGEYGGYFTYQQVMESIGNTVWISIYPFNLTVNGRILKTTDAGATWDSWDVPLAGGASLNYRFRALRFLTDSIGFAIDQQANASDFFFLHRTTNGGRTWSDTIRVEPGLPKVNQEYFGVVPIRGTNNVVLLGRDFNNRSGKSYWSTDQGVTWTLQPVPGKDLWNGAFISATQGFAVGFNNAVKYTTKNVRKVVFNANTATIPDTIPVAGSQIQLRGGAVGSGYSPITWGNDPQNNMTRVGGDYWAKTVYMQAGDTLRYKYVIAYASGIGWEQGVVPSDYPSSTNSDRSLIVPDKDTTLQVEFYNNGPGTNPQLWRPWTAVADTFINVYFRVSMLGPLSSGTFNFDNNKDTVGVRGGGPAGGDLNWSPTFYLTKESPAANGGDFTVPAQTFWKGRVRIPKNGVTERQDIAYKFLIGYDWGRDETNNLGTGGNRHFLIPVGKKDTTLSWVFYNNERPGTRPNADTVLMTWRVNLAQTAQSGGFDVTKDTIQVRTGYFSTGVGIRTKQMTRLSSTFFQATDTVVTSKGKVLDYQYYTIRNAQEVRESYYNFFYSGLQTNEAERRQIVVPTTASLTNPVSLFDTATGITAANRQPKFPNSRKLLRAVHVRYEVDLRPAYYQLAWGDSLFDAQGSFRTIVPADKDSVMKWGVWINGTALGAWSNPGGSDWGVGLRTNPLKKMFDDGSAGNGDRVANDSIFTRYVWDSPDSTIGDQGRVGQTFKFGLNAGDNEGGRGGFGNNHVENISDADSVYTLASQFGSINPKYFDAWDYNLQKPKTPTAVPDLNKPLVFSLAQNFPNPFNPSTRIAFTLPTQAKVELKVYNVLGQEVVTLVNEVKPAGSYNVRFVGDNLASGVYLYRLIAGDFTSVKKMLLVK